MNVQEISGPTNVPQESTGALEGFLGKGVDPSLDLEVLIVKDGRLQKSVARELKNRARTARQQRLQKALEKTEKQSDFKLWQRILTVTLDVGGKACEAAGAQSAIMMAIKSANDTIQPLGMMAEGLQLDAEAARVEAQGFGDKAADAGQWLSSAKEVEQRMLSRLENLDRTRHEGIMRASSFE
ncbi:MAG: hypothetical protein JRF33_11330 [Deltaproteobacteria bacterium]|nr:hypothetical protein [Deltaproteobacteria bacterium]